MEQLDQSGDDRISNYMSVFLWLRSPPSERRAKVVADVMKAEQLVVDEALGRDLTVGSPSRVLRYRGRRLR